MSRDPDRVETFKSTPQAVNWPQVGTFVGLTFGLTWLLDLILWRTVGYASPAATILLSLQMLLPACVAIVLGMFAFKDSPIHAARYRERPRWFLYGFLGYTGVYVLLAALALLSPERSPALNRIGTALSALLVLSLIVLRVTGGRAPLARLGLAGGRWTAWLFGGLALVLFYSAEMLLNHLFGLGQPADVAPLLQQVGLSRGAFVAIVTAQTLTINPFLGLIIAFGEEYGWRGYLQNALARMGRVKGVLALGVIWGLWHAPAVAMGHNFPGRPVLGVVLMTVYSTLMAYVLGYAVLKTGNVLLAAFLHQLNNGFGAYLMTFWYRPRDPAFSFFAGGLYGLPLLLLVVLLLLRDPVWGAQPVQDRDPMAVPNWGVM